MKKNSFIDVHVDKKYGDAEECDVCYGTGLDNKEPEPHEKCKKCNGTGFISQKK